MKKKILCLLLIMVSIFGLCTCGKDHGGTESQEKASESEKTEKEKEVYNVPNTPIDIYEVMEKKEVQYGDGLVLPYRIFVPDGYKETSAYPVMILLHGAGERGNDNTLQLKNAVQNLFNDLTSPIYGAIVVCPQCPEGEQWVDTPWADGNYSIRDIPVSKPMQGVMAMIEEVKKNYSVDEKRFYVTGLSMGGFGSWDLLMRNTDMFAGAVIMCGGADLENVQFILDTPIAFFHGDLDTTVPTAASREIAEEFEYNHAENAIYTELEGYGHNIWDFVSTEAKVNDIPAYHWLFQQTK